MADRQGERHSACPHLAGVNSSPPTASSAAPACPSPPSRSARNQIQPTNRPDRTLARYTTRVHRSAQPRVVPAVKNAPRWPRSATSPAAVHHAAMQSRIPNGRRSPSRSPSSARDHCSRTTPCRSAGATATRASTPQAGRRFGDVPAAVSSISHGSTPPVCGGFQHGRSVSLSFFVHQPPLLAVMIVDQATPTASPSRRN